MGWQRKQGNIKKGYKRSKKEKYTGSKRFDDSCCNHGDCPICSGNRTFQSTKANQKALEDIEDEHLFS